MKKVSLQIQTKWDRRIAYLQEHFLRLTDWEQDFVTSMLCYRDRNKDLNPPQVGKLYEIFHKVESEIG